MGVRRGAIELGLGGCRILRSRGRDRVVVDMGCTLSRLYDALLKLASV